MWVPQMGNATKKHGYENEEHNKLQWTVNK